MGTAFMTISAIHRFKVSDATVGLYTLVLLIGETIGYLVLGRLADRFGHKLSVEIGVLGQLIAFALAIFTSSPIIYFFIFVLIGLNLSSANVSGMMIVWEFCEVSRVPTYAGLANTARGVFGLLAPLLATQLATVGYGWLFGVCTLFCLVGLCLLRLWVKEPRWHHAWAEESTLK